MWLFLNIAEKAIAKKDYNSASLAFRKALLSGYENPASWKALANFLEKIDSAEIIGVWKRLENLEPDNRSYGFKQVRAALKYNRLYQAEEILVGLPSGWRDDPEYLRLQADIFTQKKFAADAEKSLRRLLALQPDDKEVQFQLLSVQAQLEDLSVQIKARSKLKEIGEGKSEFATQALRSSIGFESASENLYEADRLAAKLILRPDATVADRLLHAQLELKTDSISQAKSQADLRAYAANHPEAFPDILQWLMSSQIDPPATDRWVESLPSSLTSKPNIQASLFQFYLSIGKLDRARKILEDPKSPVYLPPKVLDLAFKALEEDRNALASAEQTWMQAIYATEGKASLLRVLAFLASSRDWTGATGRALVACADAAPWDGSAWRLLIQHENAVRNLPGLYTALQGLMRLNPYDVNVASNWALAAALVRPSNIEEVLDIAKRTYYSTYPSDPRAATAYAIALLRVGRTQEANDIVTNMSLADRREPQRAIYVGSVMAANGHKEEALDYFKRSEALQNAAFPEEITLRRIWKGVALGEETTAEEAAKILLKRDDVDVEAGKINSELTTEMRRRSNPEEARRILESLRSEADSRKVVPVEVENLIRQVRGEQKP